MPGGAGCRAGGQWQGCAHPSVVKFMLAMQKTDAQWRGEASLKLNGNCVAGREAR